MEFLSYPWEEILSGSILLLGTVLALLLLISKYPASRFLGTLILSYLVLIIAAALHAFGWLQVGAVVFFVSLYLYAKSFFEQKSRVGLWSLVPIGGSVILLYLPFETVSVVHVVKLLIAFYYIFFVIRLIRQEGKNRGIQWFLNPGARLGWFRNFIILNLIFGAGLLAFPAQPTWVLSTSVLAILGGILYQVIKESAFFSPIPMGHKYQKSSLSPAIKASILSKLDAALEVDKFYLKDDASLSSLAASLGATTHHLSQVLNESRQISFQDLMAMYRIREAKRLLRDPQSQKVKIEHIAAKVGYNSKSAFNTAFKRRTGHTPSAFRALKHVQTYREELLTHREGPRSPTNRFSLSHTFSHKTKRDMVVNFMKSFARNLRRNKVFACINLFGLTLAFVCSLYIYLFISDEMSYDQEIGDADRLYRVAWINDNPQTRTPHPMAQAMVNDWPEVEAAVSISPWYDAGLNREEVRVENLKKEVVFKEKNFFFADSTFFDVFGIEVLAGDPQALYKPFTLVITEAMAYKYFGEEEAVGKELRVNDMPILVSTVVKGLPANSHFHFEALLSYMTLKTINPDDNWLTWGDFGHFNYVKLQPDTDVGSLEAKLPKWIIGYHNWSEAEKEIILNGEDKFLLQPIADIHLQSNLRWELENNGNILYVYILTGTLVFLVLIAGINYVNLTTAKSLERAKEIGVRKTLGAISQNLSVQFYFESIAFCLVAIILSIGLSIAGKEAFNALSGKSFHVGDVLNASFLLKAMALSLVIGLVAGTYPALILSSFRPAEVLKGKLTTSNKGIAARGILVTVQFMISAILIAGSLIIMNQVDYMQSKALGFDQEAIIHMPIPVSVELGDIDLPKVRQFQKSVMQLSGVHHASASSNLPGGQFNQHPIYALHAPQNRVDATEMMLDFGMQKILNYQIVAGRDFERSYGQDSSGTNFLLNEAAVAALNLKDPIDEHIVWVDNDREVNGVVIGVVKDFHYRSLHEGIQPMIIQIQPYHASHFMIKLEGQSFSSTLVNIEKLYTQAFPSMPLDYQFLDDQLGLLYEQEQRTLSIFSVFSGIALVLACLGLFGMALTMLNQRVKEIGIRKILGASPLQIAQLVLGQFMKLIAIAAAIGLPLSYLLMQNWLEEFSYRAPVGWAPFFWSVFILLFIALLSVSSAVVRMAVSRPVNSLRYE